MKPPEYSPEYKHKQLTEWVNMTREQQNRFLKERCEEDETYCIYCQKVVKIADCQSRVVDNGEDNRGNKTRSEVRATVCPICYEEIHDYNL